MGDRFRAVGISHMNVILHDRNLLDGGGAGANLRGQVADRQLLRSRAIAPYTQDNCQYGNNYQDVDEQVSETRIVHRFFGVCRAYSGARPLLSLALRYKTCDAENAILVNVRTSRA